MGSDWRRLPVTEVCTLIVDCVNKTAPSVDYVTPYKMIRTPNIKNGRVDISDCRYVEKDIFEKWTRRASVENDDILLTREAPMGEVGIVNSNENIFLGQRIMQYRVNKKVMNPRFLLYSFLSSDLQNQFGAHEGSGSVVSHIRVPDCLKFEINVPSLEEQNWIVDVLGSIDDKIELNRQTNQTLEHIAQAIFKSWFVDFEPVKAKMAAKQAGASAEQIEQAAICAISGKTPEQLAQLDPQTLQQLKATAALFPDALVDSELGEIPEGWEIIRFSQIVEKYIDNRGKTPPIVDSGIPLLEVKHLPDHSIKPNLNTDKFVDDEIYKNWFRAHLTSEDLIISTVGTIGRLCMVPNGVKIAIAQNLLGLRFNREIVSPFFMYYLMDGKRFRDDVNNRLVITVQASIKRQDLETIDLLSPPIALQNQFGAFVRPFIEMQQSDENERLGKLRDSLLPKLLSGEINLSNL